MNNLRRPLYYLAFLLFVACDDEKPAPVIEPPSNLDFTVDVATDGSGDVEVVATAENAVSYEVFFGEQSPDNGIFTVNGTASHTYGNSGTYNIRVEAMNSQGTEISKTKSVDVEISVEIPTEGYTTPLSYDGMTLVWQDEFNGTSVNENDWTFEIGTGGNGWGNNELEYYRKENATVENGNLIITAKKEPFQGSQYTSTRMITKDKQTFKYGRIDIRAALPKGQGIWPALWMLGNDISSVGWPKSGEIDIMEMVGGQGREKTVHGTLHWDNAGSHACTCGRPGYSLSSGIFADEFHVFTIKWDETFIRWYVDDVQFDVIDISPAELSEFHKEQFFIFNVAVGGNWPGSPDASTVFPQRMVVDYVRVFQEQ